MVHLAAFGLPQQRRRLLFLASMHADARDLLLVRLAAPTDTLLATVKIWHAFHTAGAWSQPLHASGEQLVFWFCDVRRACAGDGSAHMPRRLLGDICRKKVLPLLPGPHAGRRQ